MVSHSFKHSAVAFNISEDEKAQYAALVTQARTVAKDFYIFSDESKQELAESFSALHHFIADHSAGRLTGELEKEFATQAGIENPGSVEEMMLKTSGILHENHIFDLQQRLNALRPPPKSHPKEEPVYAPSGVKFSLDDILETATHAMWRNNGMPPTPQSGLILDPPLADDQLTWKDVNEDLWKHKKEYKYGGLLSLFEANGLRSPQKIRKTSHHIPARLSLKPDQPAPEE